MEELNGTPLFDAARLRLGVFMGQAFFRCGEEITTDRAFFRFLEEVAASFATATLLVPVHDRPKGGPYAVDTGRVTMCPLPPVDQYSLGSVLAALPGTVRAFLKMRRQVDLLWLAGPHILGPLIVLLCRATGLPFFLVIRQNLVELVRHKESGIKGKIATWVAGVIEGYYRRVAARHLTLTVGRVMLEAYKERDPKAPVVSVVISMVQEKTVAEMQLSEARARERGEPRRLLAVGRLSREKGLDLLLDAVHRLVGEGRKLTLDIVGEGVEKAVLERQIHGLGMESTVTLRGYVRFGDDLLACYRSAEVFVLPSRSEGVPQVLLEAMACGTPVVAAAVGGVPYLIEEGENGLLVRPDDVEALAETIKKILDDPRLAEHLSCHGRHFVKEHTLEREREHILHTLSSYWRQRLRGPEIHRSVEAA